jgi:mRNA-degrading endonuclease toxin of MazEF toxin-antitoxin module
VPTECALSFDNLVTVPKTLLTERITRLPPARLAELCAALDIAAGCA